jgi:hypothetical protein
MRTHVLTIKERRKIQEYLKKDGERDPSVRQLAARGKRNLPQIEQDLELLHLFLKRYG